MIVSAGRNFSTSSKAPDVSMTSPRRNASAEMRPASVRSRVAGEAVHQAAAAHDEALVGVVGGDALELGAQQRRLRGDRRR